MYTTPEILEWHHYSTTSICICHPFEILNSILSRCQIFLANISEVHI